jgi:hypothetical protein
MDAAIPLWRTGVHVLAADCECQAKPAGESSLLCDAFVIVPKTSESPVTGRVVIREVVSIDETFLFALIYRE